MHEAEVIDIPIGLGEDAVAVTVVAIDLVRFRQIETTVVARCGQRSSARVDDPVHRDRWRRHLPRPFFGRFPPKSAAVAFTCTQYDTWPVHVN
jgi:hypothetical protein